MKEVTVELRFDQQSHYIEYWEGGTFQISNHGNKVFRQIRTGILRIWNFLFLLVEDI